MAKIRIDGESAQVLMETQEDVWFWERRFNVFEFLEIFPPEAITEPVPEGHVPPPAVIQLTFETDADFTFRSDIVRGGFYLRNQTQGTRKWMAAAQVRPSDTIEIRRLEPSRFRLRKISA